MEHLPDIGTTPQSKGKRHLRRPGCGPERGERTIGWSRQRSSDDPAELFPNTLCYGPPTIDTGGYQCRCLASLSAAGSATTSLR